jgi:hypothetical protein
MRAGAVCHVVQIERAKLLALATEEELKLMKRTQELAEEV